MAKYLKRKANTAEIREVDAQIQKTVETILADIENHGDTAVRELSVRFDNWSPNSFLLSKKKIDELIAMV